MIYHVFCFDFDFPEYDSYLGYAVSLSDVKGLIDARKDVSRDYALVYAFDLEGDKQLTLAARWYFGGGMTGLDVDGWQIYRPDLLH